RDSLSPIGQTRRMRESADMANASLGKVIRHLRASLERAGSSPLSDAELLERVVRQHDTAAFEALVWRHGAMVLGLCRRLLRHEQDAEDAFQAVFLILLRKADSVGKRQSLSSWLYKVAFRAAFRLRPRKQSRREQPGADLPAPESVPDLVW